MALTRQQTRSTDLFQPFLDDLFVPFRRAGNELTRLPDTDVIETETEIRVVAEMPGLRPEDVDVSLENNVLTLSGEKREQRQEGSAGGTYHLSERRYGRFSRSFVLPREVEQEKIQARFQDGVLTVTIPKTEKARRRRIEIQAEDGGRNV